MTITRRSMMAGILAGLATPAICRSENLMKIIVPRREILFPEVDIIYTGGAFVQILHNLPEGRYAPGGAIEPPPGYRFFTEMYRHGHRVMHPEIQVFVPNNPLFRN